MSASSTCLALGLTILVETPILLALQRDKPRALLAALCVNGLTNPLANAAFHELGWSFGTVELFVLGAEALLLSALLDLSGRRALIASFALNVPTAALSFFV